MAPAVDAGLDGRLVHEVVEVGAGYARGAAGQDVEVDVLGNLGLGRVHFQNLISSSHVRQGNSYVLVESSRTQQRRFQRFGKIRGSNNNFWNTTLKRPQASKVA
jgi:hypothetical protein